MTPFKTWTLCLILSLASQPLWANDTQPVLHATRVQYGPALTGRLDAPQWQQARPVQIGYEVNPGENIPASQKTTVYVVYDDKAIYFGFDCKDTHPDQIQANLTDRDQVFRDDYLIIALDTEGRCQRAYEFAVNPFGIQADLMATPQGEDVNFNAIWESAAAINNGGWTAEMRIPYASLRFPDTDIQNWAVNMIRVLPRGYRYRLSWTPQDRSIPGFLSESGRMEGLHHIKSSGGLELLPYAIGQQQSRRSDWSNPNSGLKHDPAEGRIGLGLRYAPSSNLAVSAVINPDFSQIESDAAQISVNTTFALMYPEKRPFFLAGIELMQTPLYYSRSINDPLAAGRVIGKTGALSYMLLSAYDRHTAFLIPGEEESNTVPTDRSSMANIGRIKYDLGRESHIGAMMLTRHLSGGHNAQGGLDWRYTFWRNWLFMGEAALSQTHELEAQEIFGSGRKLGNSGHTAGFDGEQFTGTSLEMMLARMGRNYRFTAVYNDISPTFQAYNSLISNTGLRQFFMENAYTLYPKNPWIEMATFSCTQRVKYNTDGRRKAFQLSPRAYIRMKRETFVSLGSLLVNTEHFRGVDFNRLRRVQCTVGSRPFSKLHFYVGGDFGRFIYRSGLPQPGKGYTLESAMTLLPTSKINLELIYTRASLSHVKTKQHFYNGEIYRAVGVYQFSAKAFFRAIAEYNSFTEAWNLYPLFSYKASAFTTFYAGISNDMQRYGDPFGTKTTHRQYFVKMQYLLQH